MKSMVCVVINGRDVGRQMHSWMSDRGGCSFGPHARRRHLSIEFILEILYPTFAPCLEYFERGYFRNPAGSVCLQSSFVALGTCFLGCRRGLLELLN